MNYYQIWCNLKDSSKDIEFCESANAYLEHLREKGFIEGHRIIRRKLGFGPSDLGEFNITMEFGDLSQMDRAFEYVSSRIGEVERLHKRVYSAVKEVKFGLYRDFPDPGRKE